MSENHDGFRRIIGSTPMDEMEIISGRHFSIGVPVASDPEFKAYVYAAGVTHALGNSSIDYQLRRNRDRWLIRFSDERLHPKGGIEAFLIEVKELAAGRADRIAAAPNELVETQGMQAGLVALIRLEATFRACTQLMRIGFPLEAEAVMRLALEQTAWANTARKLDDQEQLDRLEPQSCIGNLKARVPYAGRLYGALSKSVHLSKKSQGRYSEEDAERVTISFRAAEVDKNATFLLLMTLAAYFAVSEAWVPENYETNFSANEMGKDYSQIMPEDVTLQVDQWESP